MERTGICGDRAFGVATLTLWNSLPMISQTPTWFSFKSAPKRHWFTQLDCFIVYLLCKCPVFFFFFEGVIFL